MDSDWVQHRMYDKEITGDWFCHRLCDRIVSGRHSQRCGYACDCCNRPVRPLTNSMCGLCSRMLDRGWHIFPCNMNRRDPA